MGEITHLRICIANADENHELYNIEVQSGQITGLSICYANARQVPLSIIVTERCTTGQNYILHKSAKEKYTKGYSLLSV